MRVAQNTEPLPTYEDKKPVGRPWRMIKAYTVTVIVLSSYLWIRFLSRYRSDRAMRAKLASAHRRNAKRIYKAIVELQGLYIKIGQLFSIMTNFLPDAFRTELEALQDQVPPREYKAIERRFRDEFNGRSPKEIFEDFEELPIASASIGQVHRAKLPGGLPIVVKVQYPDIESIVHSDLIALRRIVALIQRFIPHQGLDAVYREISAIILQELDFNKEADSTDAIAANFKDAQAVKFPRIVRELSTKRVLTLEYIDGVKVNDLLGLSRLEIDRSELARLVIETYCQQIFHHGIYHADPHPGNILVSAGPTIHFLDFGAVAEVSEGMRMGMLNLLQGAIKGDTRKIIGSLKDMGFLAHSADPRVYDRVIEYFHERFQQQIKLDSFNLRDIKVDPQMAFDNLADLRKMNISLSDLTDTFHVPKEWIILERTILLLMGLCTELDPDLNPMETIRPHVEHFVLGEDGDWSGFMLDSTRDLLLSVLSLPADLRKFTNRALQGELEFKLAGHHDNTKVYYGLGQQMIFTAIGISATIASWTFYKEGLEQAMTVALTTAGVSGLFLLRSMWSIRRMLRRRRN
jgi:ubiquinone biosynthesis protein